MFDAKELEVFLGASVPLGSTPLVSLGTYPLDGSTAI